MSTHLRLAAALVTTASLALAGCTSPGMPMSVYGPGSVGYGQPVKVVVVESVRQVLVTRTASGWVTFAGTGVGAVLGGIGGSALGGGKGKQAMTVLGAAGGAALGNSVAQAGQQVPGFEIVVVDPATRGSMVVVQEATAAGATFTPGQQVRLIQGSGGARVIP